jgi:hypothetical protein
MRGIDNHGVVAWTGAVDIHAIFATPKMPRAKASVSGGHVSGSDLNG